MNLKHLEWVVTRKMALSFVPGSASGASSFVHRRCERARKLTPFLTAFEETLAELQMAWPQVRAAIEQARVRIDLKRVRQGRVVPKPGQVSELARAIGMPKHSTDRLVTLAAASARAQREDNVARALRQTRTRAVCRVCKGVEFLSKVCRTRTFRPARGNHSASFIHRKCAGQRGKVILVCPHRDAQQLPENSTRARPGKKTTRHNAMRTFGPTLCAVRNTTSDFRGGSGRPDEGYRLRTVRAAVAG